MLANTAVIYAQARYIDQASFIALQAAQRLADADHYNHLDQAIEVLNKPVSLLQCTLNVSHMVKHPRTTYARLNPGGLKALAAQKAGTVRGRLGITSSKMDLHKSI